MTKKRGNRKAQRVGFLILNYEIMKSLKTIISVVVLGLMMFVSNDSYSQTKQGDLIINASMAEIVKEGKTFYTKGMSFDSFVKAIGSESKQLRRDEQVLLNDVYNYVKNGTSSEEIIKGYNGLSLKNAAKSGAFENVPAGKKKCGFWCIIKIIIQILTILEGGLG